MKKILFVLLMISAIGLIFLNIVNAKAEPDLLKMASVLESENMDIDQWSLHARESMEQHQAERTLDFLKKQYPEWDWRTSEDESKKEITAILPEENGIRQKVSVFSTGVIFYLTYEADGKGWSGETTNLIQSTVFEEIDKVFSEEAQVFSCIYSQVDGKMKKSVSNYVVKLLSAFEAQEIESLHEDHFKSTTAFSPLFSQSLRSGLDEINLQIGARKQGFDGGTTIVVGTPIITVEY